jgi:hypothetical protein
MLPKCCRPAPPRLYQYAGGDVHRPGGCQRHEVDLLGRVELALMRQLDLLVERGWAHQQQPLDVGQRPRPDAEHVAEVQREIRSVPHDGQRRQNGRTEPRQAMGPGEQRAVGTARMRIVDQHEDHRGRQADHEGHGDGPVQQALRQIESQDFGSPEPADACVLSGRGMIILFGRLCGSTVSLRRRAVTMTMQIGCRDAGWEISASRIDLLRLNLRQGLHQRL